MKKILLALLAITAPIFAHADLIWYEGFNYADGSLTNVSSLVWKKFSGTASPSDMFVKSKVVEISATGGTVSRQDDCYRPLAVTAGSSYTNSVQVLYASFTVICTNLPNGAGSYFSSFYSTGNGFFGRIQAFTNGTVLPNTWRLGITANNLAANPSNGGYPVDLALNTPYQVVVELDPNTSGLKAGTVWVNPIDINQTGSSPTETRYTSGDTIGLATTSPVNGFAFRQASSFGNSFFQITNLALATTFAEAATNVWKTNAISPVIVYQPTGATNFTGSTISLGAVVNGQGLGNLTYQWQFTNSANLTPVNVVNPYGNSNILSVDTSVAFTNYYTLVVTTPFGLSRTSSVAQVRIADAPVPPTFTVRPASQTIYRGQTATFSTTVISPSSGNPVTFTWYSNNTVITAGQTDSGLSSSYVLDNAATNYSGTYRVAVTNLYGGIVSTNVTLTVNNPQAVSIAFLRRLVDPTTLQATNTTTPYQITGIVTTLTNITTGNTSSYYLQDGTAGINIFATGASTFRPAQGDQVTFVGVTSSFSSGLELYADTVTRTYTSYTNNSSGNPLPAAQTIPFTVTNVYGLPYLATNLAGSLVTLTNVYFGTNSGTIISTTANQNVTVTNAAGQTFVINFFYLDLDTAGQTLPDYATSVTGVLYGNHPSYSLAVTKFSDIVAGTLTLTPIPLTTSLSGSNLTITWSSSAFYLQSSTNVAGPYDYVSGATSPFTISVTSQPAQFFRLTSVAPVPPG